MIDPVVFFRTAVPCPLTQVLRDQLKILQGLHEAQRLDITKNQGVYDFYYQYGSALYVEVPVGVSAFIDRVEKRAADLIAERTKFSSLKIKVMVQKIEQLAAISVPRNPPWEGQALAVVAISDFSEFDSWRLESLDGVRGNMLGVLEYRSYYHQELKNKTIENLISKRPGEVSLFDRLFWAWAEGQKVQMTDAAKTIRESELFKAVCLESRRENAGATNELAVDKPTNGPSPGAAY